MAKNAKWEKYRMAKNSEWQNCQMAKTAEWPKLPNGKNVKWPKIPNGRKFRMTKLPNGKNKPNGKKLAKTNLVYIGFCCRQKSVLVSRYLIPALINSRMDSDFPFSSFVSVSSSDNCSRYWRSTYNSPRSVFAALSEAT